ncbi:hypothetical protein [Engelhardtia mirabilis]|uniref:SMODS and SLOG-associating 2TM effector domain-containing protein n=1 Tax=Engelhardtia mirabilis TaxID=2528011 RepID=A0A518BL95_9BACT|nr:hypothetical protein Pla133_28350 [Planctomycetes bacterium Pla133]QDV02072.1 hypothetical protein Pla86_28340 [Planctomycetes bacterium Pla86]
MLEQKNAAEIVGTALPSEDQPLDLAAHARRFQAEAPELAEVLTSDRVLKAVSRHEQAAAECERAGKAFRDLAESANEWTLAATMAGAALLFLQAIMPGSWPVRVAGAAAAVTGVGGLVYVSILRQRGDLERWRRARASEAQAFLDCFGAVLTSAGAEPRRAALGFEYLRRFLYEERIAHLAERGERLLSSARVADDRAAGLRGAGVGLLGIGGAGAVFAPGASAFVAVAGALLALASYFVGEEEWRQDVTDGQAMARARGLLTELEPAVATVRGVDPARRADAARVFYESVRAVLLDPHLQWLDGFGRRREAVEVLEERLARL